MLKRSIKTAYGYKVGEVISHPVFGKMGITGIFKNEDNTYDLVCELLEFNNTVKVFDAMDMVRLRQRRKTRLKIVK